LFDVVWFVSWGKFRFKTWAKTGAKKKSQANEHNGQNTALAVFFLIFLFSLPAVSFSDLIRKT
jgi:hypothetical protein